MELGNLKGTNMKTEIPFGEDGIIEIRYIHKDELNEILDACTTRVFDNVTHTRVEKVDDKKANILIGERAVTGWKNLTSGGKPFAFNKENLKIVMNNSYDFPKAVVNSCTEISLFSDHTKEESEKN